MKRRLTCIALSFALVAALAGCDNSKTKEEKLGFDKKEEKLLVPLPELVNSEWYENKVQIYDMVFTNDGSMTDEDIRRIVAASEYDVVLEEGFDNKGNVVIKGISIGDDTVMFDKSYDPFHDIRDIVVNHEIYDLLDACTVREDSYYVPVNFLQDDYRSNIGRLARDGKAFCKVGVEFADIETRDDLLAYLSANGYVEVEEQSEEAESFDMPHYYCHGLQGITLFRIHKIAETDQVIYYGDWMPYRGEAPHSGARINQVERLSFTFETDGTLVRNNLPIMENVYYYTRTTLVFGEKITK